MHGESLSWWKDQFPHFDSLFLNKARTRHDVELMGVHRDTFALMDCKTEDTTTPGTGPAPNGERHADHDALQGAVHSGHMKRHGVKVQNFIFPNGLTGNICGPDSARENDIWFANESEIDQCIKDLQPLRVATR